MSNITSGLIESLTGVQISGCQQNGQVQVFHLRWSGSGEVKYVDSARKRTRFRDERERRSGLKTNTIPG